MAGARIADLINFFAKVGSPFRRLQLSNFFGHPVQFNYGQVVKRIRGQHAAKDGFPFSVGFSFRDQAFAVFLGKEDIHRFCVADDMLVGNHPAARSIHDKPRSFVFGPYSPGHDPGAGFQSPLVDGLGIRLLRRAGEHRD